MGNNISRSPGSENGWHFWQVCTSLFGLVFAVNIFVTVFFWTMLAPAYKEGALKYSHKSAHLLPLVVTTIDFLINQLWIEPNQWTLLFKYSLCYSVVLITWTKLGRGHGVDPKHYVYPMVKLDTVGSYVFLVVVGVV